MSKPTFTIHSEGEFTALLVSNKQCGRAGMEVFSYQAELTVDDLDDETFVCDVLDIQKLFDTSWSKGKWEASCELLASGALVKMLDLCKDRVVKVSIRISPMKGRWVQLDWKVGDKLPVLLPHNRSKSTVKQLDRDISWSKGDYYIGNK